jgi:pSer/pThr/pTyr-binding forkhead associated (FHA) protein
MPGTADHSAAPPPLDPLARHAATPVALQALMAAERSGLPFLAVRDAEGRLAIHPLDSAARRLVTIGRSADCDVTVGWDSQVSGLHAELTETGGVWTIDDDGLSTNGTFVNGERVVRRRRLAGGDRIRVGRTVVAFEASGARRIPPTVVASAGGTLRVSEAQKRVLVALCRPILSPGASFVAPASNQQIATELVVGIDAVKTHLRALFAKFEVGDLPQNQKRTRLAEAALHLGIVSRDDLQG